MKMRVLTSTNKGKLLVLAERVATKAESTYKVDSIPPDYSLDRERLLVIVATVNLPCPTLSVASVPISRRSARPTSR